MSSVVSGEFTGTGQSSALITTRPNEPFNLSLSDFGDATILLQRSFDGGSTWLLVETFTGDSEVIGDEPEVSVQYRLNCTIHVSGTILYRLALN